MSNTIKSIEAAALETVTGGTGRSPTSTSASTSTTGTSADSSLTAQLTGLQNSIKDLAKPKSGSNTMMMFAMAMALSRPAAAPGVVVVGGGRRFW